MGKLQKQIRDEMQKALKERDEIKLSVLRGVLSAITNEAVAKGKGAQGELSDEEVISVLKREVKKRREAAEQFEKGKRPELAEIEISEIAVLNPYMPQVAPKDEIRTVAEKKMTELGIELDNESHKGALIGAVMKEMGGRAEGGDVKEVVDEIFGAK